MRSTLHRNGATNRGFALVATLMLMILLTVIAVGLLSLGSISLRGTGDRAAGQIARANARMALLLALGELQKSAGDDRRITADGSISTDAKNPNVVGVWKSWSPKQSENPVAAAPDYNAVKESSDQFVGWLTSSGTPEDLNQKDWAMTGALADPVELFTGKSDGFSLSGSKVGMSGGSIAWAVAQESTRAKLNVGGPEDDKRVANDELQVQARPSLARSESFKQPRGEWNQRANRVISMSQAKLDADLWKGEAPLPEGADFTSQGLGLLTDVVNGGLKTDLSLGFEMSDGDFGMDTWGAVKNPFRAASAPQLGTPKSYAGQRPLFHPITTSGSVHVDLLYDPASTSFEFPAAAVPTFDTLRAFYRTPYHLYNTGDGPTVFERGMDHVALKQAGGIQPSPGATPPAQVSQTSYRPVLDRVIYLLGVGVGSDKEVRLIITPIVTLWNPYNVALEIEGAVAYPWMDLPFRLGWTFYRGGVKDVSFNPYLSTLVGPGRAIDPYFFASITPGGTGTAVAGQSIRFKPGEVRVFAPTAKTDIDLLTTNSVRQRSIALMPVEGGQLNTKWGFSLPMKNPLSGEGFSRPMAATDSVELLVTPSTGNNYPLSVGLEDATRAKISNPTVKDHGQAVADVQTVNFAKAGTGVVALMKSPQLQYAELLNAATRQPFGMIETYHRVANASVNSPSDLVYTVNPRQTFVNRYLTNGNFPAGPHYETHTRQIGSFVDVQMDTTNGGRSAFYGRSTSAATGESQLSFFEVPQAPLLSLAAFQNADLAGTCYSLANQFANSWAGPYLKKETSGEMIKSVMNGTGASGDPTTFRGTMPVYDYSYLANEALWDSFFFSGAAPALVPGPATGTPAVWKSNVATVTKTYQKALADFIDDSTNNPLRNPRMRFHPGDADLSDLKADLVKPEGCLKLAGHLFVDGAFNINSTSEKAWTAFLSGMRDRSFTVRNGSPPATGMTAFPRFRDPLGGDSNNWMGFRSLSGDQVAELAKQIVIQVRKRGPFLSLGEFVNRRIDSSELALNGAIQAAIDSTPFNKAAQYDTFDISGYPSTGRSNITLPKTGVGIPGYLTQADVLQSIAPVMAARSDTFTIRGYGEAKGPGGVVLARARCEAVVQRMPEFVDSSNPPHAAVAELSPVNKTFGRRFSIVSFRYLSPREIVL